MQTLSSWISACTPGGGGPKRRDAYAIMELCNMNDGRYYLREGHFGHRVTCAQQMYISLWKASHLFTPDGSDATLALWRSMPDGKRVLACTIQVGTNQRREMWIKAMFPPEEWALRVACLKRTDLTPANLQYVSFRSVGNNVEMLFKARRTSQ
jgi:hypothetical protein